MIYKTSTLLIALMLISGFTLNAQNKAPQTEDCCAVKPTLIDGNKSFVTDTINCTTWNMAMETWDPQAITICSYDERGRLVVELHKYWNQNSDMYIPTAKISRTWYENDSLKTRDRHNWNPDLNSGSWDPSFGIYCEYNSEGLRSFTLSQYSQYGSTVWNDSNKQFIYYNTAGLVDSIITQYWNTYENQWYYSYRERNYYDADYNLTETYYDYANNLEGDFALNTRTIYLPGFTENQIQEIEQYISLNEWHNNNRHLITYNGLGLESTDLIQQWNNMDDMWDTLVMQKEEFEYYENGLIKEFRMLSHYIEWVYVNRDIREYNDYGYITSKLTQDWDFLNETWRNSELCTFPEPQTITALSDPRNDNGISLTLSPNPASDFLRLTMGDDSPGEYSGNIQPCRTDYSEASKPNRSACW